MKTIVNVIFILMITITTIAQNKIEGVVFDAETNKTIMWGNVVLYQDETIVKGVITSEEGTFVIDELNEGDYILKASYVGYKTYEINITIPYESSDLVISLEPEAAQLQEVVIQAEITTIQHKSDRKIVNVGKDLLATGTVVGEILGQLPSVKVDEQNKISLRGNQNIKILVNGRNSSLPNDRLLQQIPSEAIEKIEIINNPSAKYQAEGLSGIINIITKKSYLKGGNVGITLGAGTGSEPRLNSNIDVSYATEKIKVYANYNYNKRYYERNFTNEEERETLSFLTNGNSVYTWKTPSYAKSGVDFYIDSTNTVSAFIEYSKNSFGERSTNETIQTLNTDPTNPTRFDFRAVNGSGGTSASYNLNYRKELNKSKHYFELDANYSISPFNFVSNRTVTGGSTEFQTEDLNSKSNIITLSSDYYNSNENRTWEFGLRSELRDLDEMQRRTFINTTITNFDTDYMYNDGIYAAYGILQKKLRKFNVKTGLRLEYTDLKLIANGTSQTNNYTNLFPSISSSYENNGHNFSLSYSRRIARPNFWYISNTTFQWDQYSQFKGNPNLQPEFSNKFEFSYSKDFDGFNLNTSLFANNKQDAIRFFNTIEGSNRIRSPQNVGSSTVYGLEIYTRFKPLKWWNASFNATFYLSKYNNSQFLNNETFAHDYNFNNTFKPFDGFSIQANFSVSPKSKGIQGEYRGNTSTNLALSKDIFNKRGSISLRTNDIFNSNRFTSTGEFVGFKYSNTSISPSSRHLYVTFKYNFKFGNKNLAEKERQRKLREYTKRE